MTDRVPHCTAPRDPGLREAVGAYLLGALEPAESDRVAAHLADCSSCRAEYGELIELLPLLASVTEGEAVNGPVRPEPAVLGRVLETTSQFGADSQGHGLPGDDFAAPRRHKRARRPLRRTPRTRIALAVSCIVLAAAGSGIGVMMSSSNSASVTTAAWSATTTVQPYHVTATVQVSTASWGSKIQLKMASVPDGYTCTMVVIDRNGHGQQAGNWKAKDSGPFTINGSVSLAPNLISSIQVNLPNGRTLLTLNNPH